MDAREGAVEWLEEFVRRAGLAEDGVELAGLIAPNPSGSTRQPRLRERVEAWWRAVRDCPIEGGVPQQQITAVAQAFDDFRATGATSGDDPADWVRTAADVLRTDAHRFVRDRSDGDQRKALIAFLEYQSHANPDSGTDERTVAETFGVSDHHVERWIEWATRQSYIDIQVGGGTLLGGRSFRISSDGIDWIEMKKAASTAPLMPPPVAVAPPPWTLDVKFVLDAGICTVLERNVRELARAQAAGIHTAAIVLAGAIGEGVLYDALMQRKTKAVAASKAPKGKGGAVKDIEAEMWTLYNYIEVAQEIGVLSASTTAMAHGVLREFRNMIHPKVQVTRGLVPDEAEMKGSVAWLEALVRDVRRAPL